MPITSNPHGSNMPRRGVMYVVKLKNIRKVEDPLKKSNGIVEDPRQTLQYGPGLYDRRTEKYVPVDSLPPTMKFDPIINVHLSLCTK